MMEVDKGNKTQTLFVKQVYWFSIKALKKVNSQN